MVNLPDYVSQTGGPQADLRQIEDVRPEVANMRDSVSSLSDSASARAADLYDGTADTARWAGNELKRQARSISDTVQENPAAMSATFLLGGLFGLLVGLALGQSDRHRFLV